MDSADSKSGLIVARFLAAAMVAVLALFIWTVAFLVPSYTYNSDRLAAFEIARNAILDAVGKTPMSQPADFYLKKIESGALQSRDPCEVNWAHSCGQRLDVIGCYLDGNTGRAVIFARGEANPIVGGGRAREDFTDRTSCDNIFDP